MFSGSRSATQRHRQLLEWRHRYSILVAGQLRRIPATAAQVGPYTTEGLQAVGGNGAGTERMAIYLPGTADDQALALEEMTPREIVAELDKYVVGQAAAKRAVAIALRNRSRRQKLAPELADEIMPKNIIMIGSTGVGKTEIARRLAKLTSSPFLKVEASKFTEVGYVGRDVESMIRDLVENAIDLVREEKLEEVEDKAELAAEDRLLELLLPLPATVANTAAEPEGARDDDTSATNGNAAAENPSSANATTTDEDAAAGTANPDAARDVAQGIHLEPEHQVIQLPVQPVDEPAAATLNTVEPAAGAHQRSREKLRQQFREGKLDDRMVELDVRDRAAQQVEVWSPQSPEEMDVSLKDLLPALLGQRTKKRRMKVADAFEYLVSEEEQRLVDMDQIVKLAIDRVEDAGIIFLDEIDKIAGREGGHGPDISREGVQRDILPIVEGTTVSTKYGNVSTDHILFIAAGAFHVSKPSDLIPELQGRFPIRVELHSLTVEDFIRILTEPKSSLVKQATALLETEGIRLEFTPEALEEMARFAFRVNETTENIGARRLHTIMERVLDEISFQAPELAKQRSDAGRAQATPEGVVGQIAASAPLREEPAGTAPAPPLPVVERIIGDGPDAKTELVVVIDPEYVRQQVASIVKDQDLSRYIL
jgi:ATP-dependent HslUV protease ATP-binding subunit HslU